MFVLGHMKMGERAGWPATQNQGQGFKRAKKREMENMCFDFCLAHYASSSLGSGSMNKLPATTTH